MRHLHILFLLLSSTTLISQVLPYGQSRIIHHEKEEMQAQAQNWSIVGDEKGNIYVGNSTGLLHYDGIEWKSYLLPNHTSVRSLQLMNDTVWVGAQDEIGFFDFGSPRPKYKSSKEQIPVQQRSFSDIWDLFVIQNKVFFLSSNTLYELGDETHVGSSQNPIIQLFKLDSVLYFHELTQGIFQFRQGGSLFIPGSELLSSTGFIALNYGDHDLFFTEDSRVVSWEENTFKEITNEVHPIFSSVAISCVKKTKRGYAFGTRNNGIILCDSSFQTVLHFNKKNGLQSDIVNDIHVDKRGNLWLALNRGVDYLDIESYSSFFHPFKDASGYCSVHYQGHSFFGTNLGLYEYKDKGFQMIQGTEGQVWSLNVSHGTLWMSHQTGAFYWDKGRFKKVEETYGSWKVVQASDSLAIEGNFFGLRLFQKKNGAWKRISHTSNFGESSRFVEIDKNGIIWVAHPFKGIYTFRLDPKFKQIHRSGQLGPKQKLQSNLQTHLFAYKNEIIICTPDGIFRYDAIDDQLKKLGHLTSSFDTEMPLLALNEDHNGNLWFCSNSEVGVLMREDSLYRKQSFSYLNNTLIQGFENISFFEDHAVFGIDKGFAKVQVPQGNTEDFQIYLTGKFSPEYGDLSWLPERVKSGHHKISFYYRSNLQHLYKNISYRWRLIGQDTTWSDWNIYNHQDFIGLAHGEYSFDVEAQWQNHTIRKSYSFEVLAPWYINIWAKAVYILLFIGVLLLLTLLPNKVYRRQKEELISANKASQDEIERLKTEKLEDEIRFKNSQLASSTMHVLQKNETLNKLKEQIEKIKRKSKNEEITKDLRNVLSLLRDDIRLNEDWDKFAQYFDEIHSDFTKRLKVDFPNLTGRDLKLCAYLKMNLTTKEIAPLLNISVRGVEISRYRLRKKLSIDKSVNLNDYMSTY